jgi:2-keto-3-deoxy-L-rhamnonate aldolase RhmA
MTTTDWYWQRRQNPFRLRLEAEPAYMVGIDIPWPPLAEIIGAAGADAAFIDMEHTTLGFEDVENLIIACDAARISSIVRTPGLDGSAAARVLDSGAHAIVFPDIRTRADAELATAASKYPPLGRRPWGGAHTRYVMWEGVLASRALQESDPGRRGVYSREFVETANSFVLTIILIESPEGVENVDEILTVPGINGVWFGWADYSANVDFELDRCVAAADRVYDACRRRGIGMCLAVDQATAYPWYPGCFYFVGLDTLILSGALRTTITDAKKRVEDARDSA